MGQQQLLLIVLGIIIVGIAVILGINVFTAQSEESTKDSIVSESTNLASMAQKYFMKPLSMGGGGLTFDGSSGTGGVAWDVPAALAATANGTYTASASATVLTITGTPLSATGYGWYASTIVTPQNITTTIQSGAGEVTQGVN